MGEKIHYLHSSLEVGALGETVVLEYLLTQKYITGYIDVRKNNEYQKVDIDYLLEFSDGTYHGAEIKTDTYSGTGNIFYEEWSAVEQLTLGCFEKTKAKWLFYFFLDDKTLYIFSPQKFREWEHLNRNLFKACFVKNELLNWDGTKSGRFFHSVGRLIPRHVIERLDFVRTHDLSVFAKSTHM